MLTHSRFVLGARSLCNIVAEFCKCKYMDGIIGGGLRDDVYCDNPTSFLVLISTQHGKF